MIKLFLSYFVLVSRIAISQDNKMPLFTRIPHHNVYFYCTTSETVCMRGPNMVSKALRGSLLGELQVQWTFWRISSRAFGHKNPGAHRNDFGGVVALFLCPFENHSPSFLPQSWHECRSDFQLETQLKQMYLNFTNEIRVWVCGFSQLWLAGFDTFRAEETCHWEMCNLVACLGAEGKVNKIEKDYLGVVVLGLFNAVIGVSDVREDLYYEETVCQFVASIAFKKCIKLRLSNCKLRAM